jgi:hypothetical protein
MSYIMCSHILVADLPLKFIEVLVGLGRPDAALALHRAASSSSSSSSSSGDRAAPGAAAGVSGLGMANIAGQGTQPSIAQARILVELRLRYGHSRFVNISRHLTAFFTVLTVHEHVPTLMAGNTCCCTGVDYWQKLCSWLVASSQHAHLHAHLMDLSKQGVPAAVRR